MPVEPAHTLSDLLAVPEPATRSEQNRNYSRNIMLTHEGKTMCLADWAIHLNITYGTLWDRINNGWTTEKALSTPVKR